jgi:hypothetical protein
LDLTQGADYLVSVKTTGTAGPAGTTETTETTLEVLLGIP